MGKLPVISGKECIRALNKLDFYIVRQSGSHIVLRRDDPFGQVIVPNHKVLDRGTLRSILRGCGVTVDEFINLL
jgi:predicted RNA binding protein YcfA (HicA-like mRNA interferase family)